MNGITVGDRDTAPDGNAIVFLRWNTSDQAICEVDNSLTVKKLDPPKGTVIPAANCATRMSDPCA